MPRTRPDVLKGYTKEITSGHGRVHITVNSDKDGILEVVGHLGKPGKCDQASMEALCRVINLALRYDIPVPEIVEQLQGITCCPLMAGGKGGTVGSPADAVAKVLVAHEKGLADSNKPPASATNGVSV